jgi:hypothetical protein
MWVAGQEPNFHFHEKHSYDDLATDNLGKDFPLQILEFLAHYISYWVSGVVPIFMFWVREYLKSWWSRLWDLHV